MARTTIPTRVRGLIILSTAIASVPLMAADGTWTLLSSGNASGNWADAETGNWAAG